MSIHHITITTAEQSDAFFTMIECEKRMKKAQSFDEMFDAYCQADDIWNEFFQTEELLSDREPDYKRLYHTIMRNNGWKVA